MNPKQVIELVEKWLEDNSSVTIEELEAAYAATTRADNAADWDAYWTAAVGAFAVECAAADAAWGDGASAARYVAKYHELTKG